MKEDYLYTFIIPHKDCPDLLNRCIDSIPVRDDIQIVVVDDNSEDDKKPTLSRRENIEILFLNSKESNGAGKARNIGLEKASGRWILFPDSDDFYVENFILDLDEYKDAPIDVVYFTTKRLYEDTKIEIPASAEILENLKKAENNNAVTDYIRFKINAPWNKMVKREFINKYHIKFEEVMQGNDLFFTYQVGYLNGGCMFESKKLYNYIINKDGISRSSWDKRKIISFISGLYKTNAFLDYVNHGEWKRKVFYEVYQRIKADPRKTLYYLYLYFAIRLNRANFEKYYVEEIVRKSALDV